MARSRTSHSFSVISCFSVVRPRMSCCFVKGSIGGLYLKVQNRLSILPRKPLYPHSTPCPCFFGADGSRIRQ
jgi:hypothetical protein